MDDIGEIGLEQTLRESRYERGITLGQLAEVLKEVLSKEELDALIKLLTYDHQ